MKYLRINLPKEIKDMYCEKYKMLMKENEEDINIWKDISCLYIGKINMTVASKSIYRFNATFIKLRIAFFTGLEQQQQKISKFVETQKSPNSQRNPEVKNRA